jgi:hypothetical protein
MSLSTCFYKMFKLSEAVGYVNNVLAFKKILNFGHNGKKKGKFIPV